MRTEVEAVFLFIAELTGSFKPGSGTVQDKIACGKNDYINEVLHKLDLDDEEDRKDVHENIWLSRLYNELDHYFSLVGTECFRHEARALSLATDCYRDESYDWTVPIEVDASASMLQYMGVLLNDKRLMEMTNVIGEVLEDPWKLEGMPRLKLKFAATPMLYGSTKACHELWQDNKLKYTMEDITLYNEEIKSGPFGVANAFKDFLINHANPKRKMKVQIGGEKFYVSCNRYRNVGEQTKAYKIWDSVEQKYNVVLHTDTKKVPDLEQFRRYFVTLLIHNLDSQVADKVIGKVVKKYGWGIPIHDAFIVSPAAAADTRRWYAEQLEGIHRNRKEILGKYFKSIGINASAAEQWNNVRNKVVKFEGELKVNPMCLK